MTRGLATGWALFWLSFLLVLFPHLAARIDDRNLVRWIAVPVLIASAIGLADHYFGLGLSTLPPPSKAG